MSVQGNIKPLRSLVEPLQVAMDNGAKRALIPIENKRNFLEVTRRHHGARRPDLLWRPEDGRIQGVGTELNRAVCRPQAVRISVLELATISTARLRLHEATASRLAVTRRNTWSRVPSAKSPTMQGEAKLDAISFNTYSLYTARPGLVPPDLENS